MGVTASSFKGWTKQERLTFKQTVKQQCLDLIRDRMHEARTAMERAQESVSQQEKSSMGDKYETSRAMGQIDSDRAGVQLLELRKQQVLVQPINTESLLKEVRLGAMVESTQGIFYISIGLGAQMIQDFRVHIISPGAPVAQSMLGKESGTTYQFQGQEHQILEVF